MFQKVILFQDIHYLSTFFCISFQIVTPRVLQATLSSVGDLFVYRFTRRLVGINGAAWAVSLS